MGGTDPLEILANSGKSSFVCITSFMCMPCLQEYLCYTEKRLEDLPPNLPQQQQMEFLQTLYDDADKHIRRWVAERDLQ